MSWMVGMPNLGHTMEEGTVSQWLKQVGDRVQKGEVIAVVESDKASFEIESPADGILGRIQALEGIVVPVGDAIGWVIEPGEQLDAPAQASRAPAPQPAAASQGLATAAAPASSGDVSKVKGKISPAARALAESAGIDWEGMAGSGDQGMITRDDVRELIASQSNAASVPAAIAPSLPGASPMRRAIAQATQQSWATIPHVALHSHAEADALMAMHPKGITAAIVRACALALKEHPAFNGWYREQGFESCDQSHVAVAVSTPGGLLTPVIHSAQGQSVAQLKSALEALAQAARSGQLDGARTVGGTFTVSSLGQWGVDAFAPIISAPQVAILGVGRLQRVAREARDGGVRFVSTLNLTLVFDHRANDGVEAARFLAAIVTLLEQPERLRCRP